MNLYRQLAAVVLLLHLCWLGWVIFGCLFTRHRRWLCWFHIASLLYGIAIELGPWWCPLTLLEQALLDRAGLAPYHEGFILHYLQAIVYPDLPPLLLTWAGVAVCFFNLGVYSWRFRRRRG